MYKKGDIQRKFPTNNEDEYEDIIYDNRLDDDTKVLGYYDTIYYLPHSCDSWVIGGVEQLKQLQQDINDLLLLRNEIK